MKRLETGVNSERRLGQEWDRCLSLALEAICAGSLGISAVVSTAAGDIVSSGRNQLFDSRDSGNAVKDNTIAHAELNAIAAIPKEYQEDRDLTLFATVEPCPMCLGAIVMSRIRDVHVASRDLWAGSVRLLDRDWYLRKKHIQVSFESGAVERLFFLLHLLSIRRRFRTDDRAQHPFLTAMQSEYPEYCAYLQPLEADAAFAECLERKDGQAILAKITCLGGGE